MKSGRFTADTVETLGKRAALTCSNPDCGALTTGPALEESGSVNVGEAAHIYGLTEQSARFSSQLTPVELSDITNGVWLCRNCHKAADNDALRFPADLLFQWRRQHEASVRVRIGRPGDNVRESLKVERLRKLGDVSYLAQQIILDRPPLWEFKLTAEILRTELGELLARWGHLKRGMYARKSTIIPVDQLGPWLSARCTDASRIVASLPPLMDALTAAQGPPGTAGDDKEIITICRLIVSSAQSLIDWEEDVRFAHLPEEFKEVQASLQGVAGHQLQEIFRIPEELSRILSLDNPTGTHGIDLVFTMPDGFLPRFEEAMDRAVTKFSQR